MSHASLTLPFIKMHGAGNDFVIIHKKDWQGNISLPQLASNMCQRQTGIGADQLLYLSEVDKQLHMDIFNADGSSAQMCGNGLRCVAALWRNLGHTTFSHVITPAGKRQVRFEGEQVWVEMGVPHFNTQSLPAKLPSELQKLHGELIPIQVDGENFSATLVSMGNPHCVIFTNRSQMERIAQLGPKLEHHAYFPERCNIMLAIAKNQDEIELSHWERGSGLTLACGSGASATAAVAIRRAMVQTRVTVHMRGGDLQVQWSGAGTEPLWMTGPVKEVFQGVYRL